MSSKRYIMALLDSDSSDVSDSVSNKLVIVSLAYPICGITGISKEFTSFYLNVRNMFEITGKCKRSIIFTSSIYGLLSHMLNYK